MKDNISISNVRTSGVTALNLIMGRLFKEIRTECGLNKSYVASRLGLPLNQLNLIESGSRKPAIDEIVKFCCLFKLDPTMFFIWCYERSDNIDQTKIGLINSMSDTILNNDDLKLHTFHFYYPE